jgi:hypothetical protein
MKYIRAHRTDRQYSSRVCIGPSAIIDYYSDGRRRTPGCAIDEIRYSLSERPREYTAAGFDCAKTLFDSYITVRSRSDTLNANAVTDGRVHREWIFLLPY